MALDFTSKADVLGYLTDRFPNADETVLEALLDASAATTCTAPIVPVYRPFWIEANQLAASPGDFERVRSAAGSEVVYRDAASAVRALKDRQAALDAAYCNVPPGFGVGGKTFSVVF